MKKTHCDSCRRVIDMSLFPKKRRDRIHVREMHVHPPQTGGPYLLQNLDFCDIECLIEFKKKWVVDIVKIRKKIEV